MNLMEVLTRAEPPAMRKGRCVAEGYARGWGIQYGDIREMLYADPLFGLACFRSNDRTLISEENRMNLFLLIRYFLSRLNSMGNIIEFGSYKGGGAIFMATIAKAVSSKVKVFALDTFLGMPETDKSVDMHDPGDFQDANFESMTRYAKELGLDNLHFIKGLFQDTAPGVINRHGPFGLVHVDCDIASAVAYSYEITRDSMVPGGYWVFDDPLYSSCIGAAEVVEDLLIRRDCMNAEQFFPHMVFRAPM